MPTKSDRILSYLPGTFKRLPQKSALFAIVDAFGGELLQAENSLAAIMQAHWVDHADRGSDIIVDLAQIASLYGLAPRCDEPASCSESDSNSDDELCVLPPGCDETVEEFREHLKRYVRTFLEGTVTVQGILRVTAEALALHIADDYEALDTWWDRAEDTLVTTTPRGDDAAWRLFGFRSAMAVGSPARPAQVVGSANLGGRVDLSDMAMLRLQVDDIGPVTINLTPNGTDPTSVSLDAIKKAINQALGNEPVADHDDRYLSLTSLMTGAAGRVEILDVVNDAAEKVLGVKPHLYLGTEARAATVSGTVDLSAGADLSTVHFIRLVIDGSRIFEIEFEPVTTVTLDQIKATINDAIGEDIATHDNRVLTLTSATTGLTSSITFQQPATQNATPLLFGNINTFHQGQDVQPARVTALVDLSDGVDLRQRPNIRVSLDGNEAVTINCAGQNPVNTRPAEIATAINAAFGETVARQNGRFITLSSLNTGSAGSIVFETLAEGDATELIFGIGPRAFRGSEATAARLVGQVDLSTKPEHMNLLAQHRLLLAVDGRAPLEVDLRVGAGHAETVSLPELVGAINTAVGETIAGHDNKQLILHSTTAGSQSSLTIHPLEAMDIRRFVTRAKITDEAAQAILGFVSKKAEGAPATAARLTGQKDLSRGVDLGENRFLRLVVDNGIAEIDCAGVRPRATLLEEIVTKINADFSEQVALDNGKNLILQSPTSGSDSRIAFEPPQATDALNILLGVEPGTIRGQSATSVRLTGTVDLSQGIDLAAGASIKLEVDDISPPDPTIELTAEDAHLSLTQLVLAINQAIGSNVASHNGTHLVITSTRIGSDSQLAFEPAGEVDTTEAILGFAPPRTYIGSDAAVARVVGQPNLSGTSDLSTARFLRIGLDGDPAVTVDCATNSTNPEAATLGDIVEAINVQIPAAPASSEGTHLVLTSPTDGTAGRITLELHLAGDARELLFGSVPDETLGKAPAPATIMGEVDLLAPVDLSERSVLRLAVNGQRPVDIDVVGAAPEATFLDEIMAAINSIMPGLASQTDDDRLQLTSPASGEVSHLEVQPLRYLELIEYPLQEKAETVQVRVQHRDGWVVNNKGTADTYARVSFTNSRGTFGPTLINKTLGWQLRLQTVLLAGETVHLWSDGPRGLVAEIVTPLGERRLVPALGLMVGPLGTQTSVPSTKTWSLTGNKSDQAMLQLNNPAAPHLVQLRAHKPGESGLAIQVTVRESSAAASTLEVNGLDGRDSRLIGRIQRQGTDWSLVDEPDTVIVQLRPGVPVDLSPYENCPVVVTGFLHANEPPVLVLQSVACLFDVELHRENPGQDPTVEAYPGVTIGVDLEAADALTRQINADPEKRSQLVTAVLLKKVEVLRLPKGRSDWVYLDCPVARFNEVNFDQARFPGEICEEQGVFNISRFSNSPPEKVKAVFASAEPRTGPPTDVKFSWQIHQPGAFQVNLPADLPPRFGGRFNQARFGQGPDSQEKYQKAVAEPSDDPMHLVNLIQNNVHSLVTADFADIVPLGWEAITIPFRQPQFLTLGNAEDAARLYLSEEGVAGFIEIRAREAGSWGNEIAVSARSSGPAMYDVCIIYEGGRYENAREVVRGKPPPALTQEMLEAGPIGILQAKAAGIGAEVTRNGAD